MHRHDEEIGRLADAVMRYALDRIHLEPPPLDGPRRPEELRAEIGPTITEDGIGGHEALRVFGEVLAPACISIDHPRFLSFVPAAPTEASILFDLVVGASSIYAGSWLEGGGAIYAENEALRWIADLAGLPADAGGVFVSGGSAGNLSALIAARWKWRHDAAGELDRTRGLVATSRAAHSSVAQAARAMDADVLEVPVDARGRLRGDALAEAVAGLAVDERRRLFAVVATSGTTNLGIVDDLAGVADVCDREGIWFHVDGAYGGAALASTVARHRFVGIERADSFIVDPHKWLFAPFDCCALVYRDPRIAKAAHTQRAEYLDVLHDDDEWNASDYAHHLSRRARGLPLWFSLATHGTAAYVDAVDRSLRTAHAGAELVRQAPHLELALEPELSIVVFRRIGWRPDDYQRWSDDQLARQESFVVPTSWQGETVLRICVVNPQTTVDDLAAIFDSLAGDPPG